MKDKQPIYFFIYGHHYLGGGGTIPTSRDIKEYAEIIKGFGAKGTFFFDGILVEHLKKEDSDIFTYLNTQNVCLGYHGEETHGPYPVLVDYLLKGVTKQDMIINGLPWDNAVHAIEQRYTHMIEHGPVDPLTWKIDVRQKGQSDMARMGGIALVQQAFGRDVDIITTHSIEAAPAGYAFAQLSRSCVVQATPPLVSHYMKIVGHEELEKPAMSIGGENSLFIWYMNKLNTKESDEDEVMVLVGTSFDQAFRKLHALDRQRPHIVSIIMEPGPGKTKDNFSNFVEYIAAKFIPEDGCSRFIDPNDMLAMVEPQNERPLTQSILKELALSVIKNWKNRPPDWLKISQGDFSLVNAFEGLVLALAGYQKKGILSLGVTNTDLLGPIGNSEGVGLGRKCSIPLVDLLTVVETLPAAMIKKEPHCLPYSVQVAEKQLNTAELLLVLAKAYLIILEKSSQSKIVIEPAEITPPYADILQKLFKPENILPLWYSKLQLWTVKPARLK